jgi:adenosine deaminase
MLEGEEIGLTQHNGLRGWKTEIRDQKSENREQRTEIREQRSENREQRTEIREQ